MFCSSYSIFQNYSLNAPCHKKETNNWCKMANSSVKYLLVITWASLGNKNSRNYANSPSHFFLSQFEHFLTFRWISGWPFTVTTSGQSMLHARARPVREASLVPGCMLRLGLASPTQPRMSPCITSPTCCKWCAISGPVSSRSNSPSLCRNSFTVAAKLPPPKQTAARMRKSA